jgi:hypothetical protein
MLEEKAKELAAKIRSMMDRALAMAQLGSMKDEEIFIEMATEFDEPQVKKEDSKPEYVWRNGARVKKR